MSEPPAFPRDSSPAAQRLTPRDLALYATVVVAWGSSWIATRLQAGEVASEISVMWRFLAAGLLLLAFARLRGDRLAFGAADQLRFGLMGFLLFSAGYVVFYQVSALIPSGLLAVVFSLAAIINLGLAALIARRPPPARVLAGAVLGAAGIALLFGPEIAKAEFGGSAAAGLLGCLAGTLSFCLGGLASAESQRRGVGVIAATGYGMVYGAAMCAAYALLAGKSFGFEWSARYVLSFLWLTVVASLIAFTSYLTLLGRIGAGRAGYATVMFPVIALAISTVAEGYAWTAPAAAGAVLALAGNFLVLGGARGPAAGEARQSGPRRA